MNLTNEKFFVKTQFKNLFADENTLTLENNKVLSNINVAFQTYGTLNSEGTNAVLICHALTGNAHAAGFLEGEEFDRNSKPDFLNSYSLQYSNQPGWWEPLIGPGKIIDTNKYFVVCSNILGSCYGTTGPTSILPHSKNSKETETYKNNFPIVTVRDMVRVEKELLNKLNVNHLEFAIGGSLGGMQVLEWMVMYPDFLTAGIPIATSAKHSAWAISLNETARNAIMNDPTWKNGKYTKQPEKGLSLARKIAMLSYRTQPSFERKFGRDRIKKGNYFKPGNLFQAQNYLDYQGKKLVKRFDANSYIYLTHAMDFHDLSYNRESLSNVLNSVKCKTLCIGIDSDILYPTHEQKEIAILLGNSNYAEINSIHGHDAFLIEFEQLNKILHDFLSDLN